MTTDTKVVQQSVTVAFNDTEYVPAKYVFEMDDRPDADQTLYGAVRIRKYPAFPPGTWSPVGTPLYFDQGVKVLVTEGTINATGEVREKEVSGSSIINGDSEVALAYPVVHGLQYAIDGVAYDIRGREVSVNIGFDSVKNAIVLSKPCYVVVKYSYVTQYQILRYYPSVYNDFEVYYMPDPADYGQLLGFIQVPSVLDPVAPVVFSIVPPEGISAEFELYRVESVGFAKEDGIWEKPMGWPDDGTYPNSSESLDANDSLIELSRTHEIGYFSLLNNPRRMESYQSATSEALPLDFTKELKNSDYAGSRVTSASGYKTTYANGASVESALVSTKRIQSRETFDKYRRMLNRAPKMRTVHYDVAIGEPYRSESAVNSAREVVRTVSTQRSVDTSGNAANRSVVRESLLTFRVKLVVKAPTRPSVSVAVIRNQANGSNTDFNTQAQRINTMLSVIWEGIDWAHIRKRILAAYDTDLYEVSFDSSFPNN